jgi:hypothetical protein
MVTERPESRSPVADRDPTARRRFRDLGDIILALLPFIAIAVLIGIGAYKARCGG